MSTQVGSASVAIFPIFKGFRKITDKAVQAATDSAGKVFQTGFSKSAASAGTSAGQGFSKNFNAQFTDQAPKSMSALTKAVADASRSLSSARLSEADALGKVNVAQSTYAAAQQKYAAGAPQLVRAFETLSSAQRRYSAAQDVTTAATGRLKGAQAQLSGALDEVEKKPSRVGTAFGNLGDAISTGFSNVAGFVVSAVGSAVQVAIGLATGGAIAITAALGGIVAAGFTRLSTIETAQAKLKALGNTQADIAEIMTDANNAVIGTQYSLADAVTAAASAVAAGIKPGQQLTDYLKLNANAAAVAGVAFSDLSLVMNQVRSQGKAYTQDLNQVASRGIPIWQGLQDVYGVTRDKLTDMVQKGEIDADHFEAALRSKVGNAADEIGKTTTGSFENMKAAISRFGAVLVSPVFGFAEQIFTGITNGLDKLKAALQPIIDKYAPDLTKAFSDILAQAGPFFDQVVQKLVDWANSPDGTKFFEQLTLALQIAGKAIVDNLPQLLNMVTGIGQLIATFTLFAAVTAPLFINGFATVGSIIGTVASNISTALQAIIDGNFWQIVADKFSNGWTQITDAFSNGWTQLSGWFNSIYVGILNFGIQVVAGFAKMVSGIASQLGQAVANITKFPDYIVNALSGAGNWLVQTGRNVVQGFINGIAQLAPSIGRAFLNLVPAFIRGPFEAALGINSPSKVFFQNGVYTMQGYINGVDSMAGKVSDTMTGLAPSQMSGTSSTSSSATSGYGTGSAPLIGTVVAPDQNPVVSGRIIGEEVARLTRGLRI